MNIKQFFTGLFGRGKKSESTDIQASDAIPADTTGNYVSITEPKPVASPPGWQPYTDKCHPIRSGWYAVVFGTRCQIKWYNAETDTFSKIPLNYPVEFFLILPPLPIVGRAIKDKNKNKEA